MEQYQFAVTLSGLAAAVVALAVLLVRQWRITRFLRRGNKILTGEQQLYEEELRHLVGIRLPELMDFLHGRSVAVSGPLHEERLHGTVLAQALQQLMDHFGESVEQSKTRADQSAKATLRAMMRTVQSLANEQQLDISAMQDRHDDPDVLEDLLKIDHMNSQIGRRAQATAVLCGSWPGQQRSASSLSDVARGATSRIRDYRRVKVPSQVNVAVAGRAVEPVVLALAELLDNATRHSPPDTSVEVNFQSTHNGVAIMVDDAGVAMDAEELAQAARLLSGRHQVPINRLGDPPQIGFAVIGVLAGRYGFSVSVDTRSPYGGVRAVVFLPAALLTRMVRPPETAGTAPAAVAPDPPAVRTPLDRTNFDPAPLDRTNFDPAPLDRTNFDPAPLQRAPQERAALGGRAALDGRAAPDREPLERTTQTNQSTAGGLPKRRRVAFATPAPAEPNHTGAAYTGSAYTRSNHTGPTLAGSGYTGPGQTGPALGPPQSAGPDARTPDRPGRHARQTAAGMGAWQRGTRSGRAVAPLEGEGNDLQP